MAHKVKATQLYVVYYQSAENGEPEVKNIYDDVDKAVAYVEDNVKWAADPNTKYEVVHLLSNLTKKHKYTSVCIFSTGANNEPKLYERYWISDKFTMNGGEEIELPF